MEQSKIKSDVAPVYVFAVVNSADAPLFECDLSPPGTRTDTPHLDQFVIYAALDVLDDIVWQTQSLYLKQIDRFNDLQVAGYVTPGHSRFLLLYRPPNSISNRIIEESIKEFFFEVHELYIKVEYFETYIIKTIMNPFIEPHGVIVSSSFDEKLRNAAYRILPGIG